MIFPSEEARITASFEDYAGDAYNPTSRDYKIYDSTNTLIDTKNENDDTYSGTVGSYYLDYLIPANAELGRWRCMIIGDDKGVTKQTWIVRGEVWPSAQDIYDNLAGMEEDRVGPEAVEENILKTVLEVDLEKSASADTEVVEQTYVIGAMVYTYISYTTELERSIGMIPPPMAEHLRMLKEEYEKWLNYCRRGVGHLEVGPIKSVTPTAVPDAYKSEWP